jgi:hypothetical protein
MLYIRVDMNWKIETSAKIDIQIAKVFFITFILNRSFYSVLLSAITSMMSRVISKNIAAFSMS